jgi:transketolase
VYAFGSDGEQAKGQVAEARRFAIHHGLDNVVVLLDINGLQISGATDDVMAVAIEREYAAAGWRTTVVDGHDAAAIGAALDDGGPGTGAPLCILGRTVMGRGVPFIEHDPAFHGKALSSDEYARAMRALGLPATAGDARARRASATIGVTSRAATRHDVPVRTGERRVYAAGTDTDMRSAWGQALVDLGELNQHMLVFRLRPLGIGQDQIVRRALPGAVRPGRRP